MIQYFIVKHGGGSDKSTYENKLFKLAIFSDGMGYLISTKNLHLSHVILSQYKLGKKIQTKEAAICNK